MMPQDMDEHIETPSPDRDTEQAPFEHLERERVEHVFRLVRDEPLMQSIKHMVLEHRRRGRIA